MKPLCFVLMPFGVKPNGAGNTVNFDAVYHQLIAPSIEAAELEPIRADEELVGGIIHKPMFERLLLCEFAIADLTTANANVFYELGVRHAMLPGTTVLLQGGVVRLPFDVAPLRTLNYQLDPSGSPASVSETRETLVKLLMESRKTRALDSPVFQLLEGYPDIKRLKTDVFRERIEYAEGQKRELAEARRAGLDAVREFERKLGDIGGIESAVVIDLFLSYRAVKGWKEMVALTEKMPKPLAETVMVKEQLALALNRMKYSERAEQVLSELIERRGPSSETYGILGRVYKDRWEAAAKSGSAMLARGFLDKAIDAYLKGFETDWRDAFPGINAVTLMTLREPPDARRDKLIPVVAYSVERRIASGSPDYWDFATRLEIAMLAKDEEGAMDSLSRALAVVRERWEPETTLRNLRLIREARERRGGIAPWMLSVEEELTRAITS
jgi:tetratricopeptide (TPR) repeat protein